MSVAIEDDWMLHLTQDSSETVFEDSDYRAQ